MMSSQETSSLLLCSLFYKAICFSFAWCYFVLVFFSPLSIGITSLEDERANLSAFRTFVRFSFVLFFSVSSSCWCLGMAAACDRGTPWTFLLPFLRKFIQIDQFICCSFSRDFTISMSPQCRAFTKPLQT